MGKASSNKKIARAQRAGAKAASGPKASLLFPAVLSAVVVVGLVLVVVARSDRTGSEDASIAPIANVDHWHAAYGISNCGEFLPPILDQTDPQGIHSHADGVIHIHPFSEAASGRDATLGKFLDAIGLEVTPDAISIPDGETLEAGADCDGEPAVIKVARWANADNADAEPDVFTEDFGSVRFLRDRQAVTIYYGPEDGEIPPPETIPALDQLTDVVPTEPPAGDPPATAPGETTESTEPGATTDSTEPGATSDATQPAAPTESTEPATSEETETTGEP
jgi:hypothetical protein